MNCSELLKNLSSVRKELQGRKLLRCDTSEHTKSATALKKLNGTSRGQPFAFARKWSNSGRTYDTVNSLVEASPRRRTYQLDAVKLLDSRIRGFLGKHLRIWKKAVDLGIRKQIRHSTLGIMLSSVKTARVLRKGLSQSEVLDTLSSDRVTGIRPDTLAQSASPVKGRRGKEFDQEALQHLKILRFNWSSIERSKGAAKVVKSLWKFIRNDIATGFGAVYKAALLYEKIDVFCVLLSRVAKKYGIVQIRKYEKNPFEWSPGQSTRISMESVKCEQNNRCIVLAWQLAKTIKGVVNTHLKDSFLTMNREWHWRNNRIECSYNHVESLRGILLNELLSRLIDRSKRTLFTLYRITDSKRKFKDLMKTENYKKGIKRLVRRVGTVKLSALHRWRLRLVDKPTTTCYVQPLMVLVNVFTKRKLVLYFRFISNAIGHVRTKEKAVNSLKNLLEHRLRTLFYTMQVSREVKLEFKQSCHYLKKHREHGDVYTR